MAIYELTKDKIREIEETRFADAGINERGDLQRLLREKIEIISPDTLVIAEEFGEWEDSKRRIDLLGLDKDANLVVIELKRTEDGGHMELQAIRYAAMVSAMTFENAVEIYRKLVAKLGRDVDPEAKILEHLGWAEPNEDEFAQDVRIVLASAEFSKELTTAVMWLNDRDLDIQCVRLKPYRDGGRILLDVQRIIPLPEVEDYRVQIKEKQRREREARTSGPYLTKYDVTIDGQKSERMAKRNAIFTVVKHLCDKGASPEKIMDVIYWKRNTLFRTVEGSVDSEEFIRLASEKAEQEERRFDAPQYYTEDDELIVFDNRTYAFTKMWGNRTLQAIDLLKEAFPETEISYAKSL
ncbi:MAG: hypothetical protein ACOX1P_21440 [Thermoguttaceae bacterium]|jgi:hypothetical protein